MALPPELVPVDRICQCWATSINGGGYEPWADTLNSKAPALPEDLALEVDLVIRRAPRRTSQLLSDWYCTPKPAEVIARKLGCSRPAVYAHFAASLWYLRGVFEANGILARFIARGQKRIARCG